MPVFKIITVAQKMPDWVTQAFNEYHKRFNKDLKCQLIEIPIKKRGQNISIEKCLSEEAHLIEASLNPGSKTFALDVKGKSYTSEALAESIEKVWQQTSQINFIIGGPDGLDESILKKADIRWSLSPLTLPHGLVRIVLIEQLYRSYCILKNHPYHRA